MDTVRSARLQGKSPIASRSWRSGVSAFCSRPQCITSTGGPRARAGSGREALGDHYHRLFQLRYFDSMRAVGLSCYLTSMDRRVQRCDTCPTERSRVPSCSDTLTDPSSRACGHLELGALVGEPGSSPVSSRFPFYFHSMRIKHFCSYWTLSKLAVRLNAVAVSRGIYLEMYERLS